MAPANIYLQSDDSKICVVMVGLPARGKSLIAGKGELNDPVENRIATNRNSHALPRLGGHPRAGLQRW